MDSSGIRESAVETEGVMPFGLWGGTVCHSTRLYCLQRGAQLILSGLLSIPAAAEILPKMPDAIVCSVRDPTGVLPWERLVFYASAQTREGRTLYKTLTSDPVVVFVDADGTIDGSNLADCDGRHVDQLMNDGRAFVFTTRSPEG